MAEKVVINSSRVVQEVSIVSQPNITKVYINNNGNGANFNLDVSELGDAPVNNVNSIVFEGATVTDEGGGIVKVEITGGGGIPDAPNDANAYVRSALSWVIGYTKTAIDAFLSNKENTITAGTTSQFYRGDKTFQPLPDATPMVKGIAKLYNSLGTGTDGSIDRTTITNEINAINFNVDSVLENEILQNGLVYQVPNIDGSYGTGVGSQYLRLLSAPTTQNTVTTGTFGLSCGILSTTSSAGGIAFIRRNDAINLQSYTNIQTIRDFTVDANISNDCRYFTGWSKNFQFSSPTNIAVDLQTECILVGKLSTSNNLHVIHNDNTGTATTIDLGANFPANSTLYKYRMILTKITASNYNLLVVRTTFSDGSILLSSLYNLTTNLPTSGGVLQQIHFITNNASAVDMRLGDYGLIVKKAPL